MFTRAAARAEILSEIMPFGSDGYQATEDDEVPDGWYENDLHLAAELGKTLLERNKGLEASLLAAQQQSEEQETQIVYLEKQLHILRDVTESKAHIYEQLDISSQELEKENQEQKHELKTTQQKSLRMKETLDSLETQVQDQQALIEQLRAAEKERLKEGRKQQRAFDALSLSKGNWGGLPLRRAHSYDLGKPTAESLYEEELSGLQLANRTLRQELVAKETNGAELESEIAVLVRENKVLESANRELQVKVRMLEIKRDYRSLDNLNEAICQYCSCVMNCKEGEEDVEEDEQTNEGEVEDPPKDREHKKDAKDRLKEGELKRHSSLDLRPITEESCGESTTKCPLSDHRMVHSKSSMEGLSILGEIDAQYHNLMDQYTTLLKRSRSTSFNESSSRRSRSSSFRRRTDSGAGPQELLGEKNASPTKASIMSASPSAPCLGEKVQSCPVDDHFESGPPEYKQLFKKIYEVLHRPLKKQKQSKGDSQ